MRMIWREIVKFNRFMLEIFRIRVIKNVVN